MSRVIKFRVWTGEQMLYPPDGYMFEATVVATNYPGGIGLNKFGRKQMELMQFTGLKDKNGKEIFEGDIFRIEEETDTVDHVLYVVVTFVQEWCMFATLRVEDEYPAYLNEGITALDEPMFWTYTLEDTNSRKHFLCGNIYENTELIPQLQTAR